METDEDEEKEVNAYVAGAYEELLDNVDVEKPVLELLPVEDDKVTVDGRISVLLLLLLVEASVAIRAVIGKVGVLSGLL